MQCFEPASALTAEAVTTHFVGVQQALAVISTINFWGYLNPYGSCALNASSFDYIIVGGGTSGCVLANRLSEDPNINILLIEAGDNFQMDTVLPLMVLYMKQSRIDWNFTVEHNLNETHQQNNFFSLSGKVIGGTSSVDLMLHSQGFGNEYDEWAKLTNEPAWEFVNVLKLFKKLERLNDPEIAVSPDKEYHGFSGKVGLMKDKGQALDKYLKAVEEAGHKIVLDINNGTRKGYTGAVYYIEGRRQTSALAYLHPIRQRKNLVVLKQTQVVKVLFDNNKRAVGVVAINTKTHTIFTFISKLEVIITAGTYNTAKLLQLSGIGPQKLLSRFGIEVISDIPVGYNFHSHVSIPVVHAGEKTSNVFVLENFDPNDYPVHTMEGFASLNKYQLNPDYRSISFILPFTPATMMLEYTSAFYRYDANISDYWYRKVANRETIYTVIDALKPISRGSVQIRSTNPFDPPIIEAKYLSEKTDMENMIKYLKHFLKLGETRLFKSIGGFFVDPMKDKCGFHKFHSNEYWKCYVQHLMTPKAHQCGTAAMGSVVDGRLRVYGVKSLRVADASIMPTIISGSTTIPTMMIGENAAEMIKQDYYTNFNYNV